MRELLKTDPNVELVWRAFELRPEPVPLPDPQGDYLQNVWTNSVAPLAQRLGVIMKMPPVKPRTRLAHEAAHWARAHGRFEDYHDQIFRAYFERGEDTGDVNVLLAIAQELQLDGHSLRQALNSHEFADDVLADEREAADFGVHGVPAFIAHRRAALSGVQPLGDLRKLIESVRGAT